MIEPLISTFFISILERNKVKHRLLLVAFLLLNMLYVVLVIHKIIFSLLNLENMNKSYSYYQFALFKYKCKVIKVIDYLRLSYCLVAILSFILYIDHYVCINKI